MEAVYSRLAQFSVPQGLSLNGITGENGSLTNIRTRFSQIKGPRDFFDVQRMSKPAGLGDAQARVSYNLRYFSANYGLILAMLVIYALLTNLLLLFVMIVAVTGFMAISALHGADLIVPGGYVITQQSLYIALGVITIPLFLIASPLATLFWLLGAASVLVIGHAAIMEKPLESEFAESV